MRHPSATIVNALEALDSAQDPRVNDAGNALRDALRAAGYEVRASYVTAEAPLPYLVDAQAQAYAQCDRAVSILSDLFALLVIHACTDQPWREPSEEECTATDSVDGTTFYTY